jgi:hypothetical protein
VSRVLPLPGEKRAEKERAQPCSAREGERCRCRPARHERLTVRDRHGAVKSKVDAGTRTRQSLRVTLRAAAALCALCLLAGCGGSRHAAPTTTEAATILGGDPETVTFGEIRSGVDRLYRAHPGIATFVVRDVAYTPRSRDQVLRVCRTGGAEQDPRLRESARVLACAPLIFFFYEFGRRRAAPQSLELARKLYWYAATVPGPFEPRPRLTELLGRWGIA